MLFLLFAYGKKTGNIGKFSPPSSLQRRMSYLKNLLELVMLLPFLLPREAQRTCLVSRRLIEKTKKTCLDEPARLSLHGGSSTFHANQFYTREFVFAGDEQQATCWLCTVISDEDATCCSVLVPFCTVNMNPPRKPKLITRTPTGRRRRRRECRVSQRRKQPPPVQR